MRKVLIIGASGLVGNYLYKEISPRYETIGTFHNYPLHNLIYLDITDRDAVKKIIINFKPDFVFLPAALTNVDLCEENKELCWRINVKGVDYLVSILRDTNIKLIYFSTDYIFDGQNGPYSEVSQPGPLSVYGSSKLEGEKVIGHNLNNFLVIRTTCVYGWEAQQKNFVFNLVKRLNTKENVNVPFDQLTTPTYARSLAGVAWQLAREDKKGVYNVVGSSLVSRLDFALLVAEVFGLDKNLILGVKTEELLQKAKRPLNGGLRIDKVIEELKTKIPTVKESLLLMRKERGYGEIEHLQHN